jgi:hypothetical protein
MNRVDSTIQRNEEEFPSFEVSDEVLEGAAGADAFADYTYYNCTYGYCPGY